MDHKHTDQVKRVWANQTPVTLTARSTAFARSLAPALAVAIGGVPGWIAVVERLTPPGAGWIVLLRGISEVAALLGTGLAAASLALMLRVGWLERAFGGLDRIYFAHHLTGVLAFLVLLVHSFAVGLGYLLKNNAALALAATLPDPRHPAILAGWIALLWLMAMLIATFHGRISYAGWRILHASSGLVLMVALVHPVCGGGCGAFG